MDTMMDRARARPDARSTRACRRLVAAVAGLRRGKEPPASPAAGRLDVLTKRWTAFRSFDALLAGGHDGQPTSYYPSLSPGWYSSSAEIEEIRAICDAYDRAQADRGDPRRAYRGAAEWWRPGLAPGGRPEREPKARAPRTVRRPRGQLSLAEVSR